MLKLRYVLYPICFLFGVIISLNFKGCSGSDVQKVIVPEKKGTFTKYDTVYRENIRTKFVYKKDTIELENPINTDLALEYINTLDSLKRLQIYLKAIQEREETYVFDNEDLKLEVATKTRGEILKILPTYTIKEREIEVAQKKTVLAMYLGGGVYNTVDMDNLGIKIDAGLQNKRGDIFTIGVDNRQNIFLGIQTRIFNIQK
jgi:hypothetical protein